MNSSRKLFARTAVERLPEKLGGTATCTHCKKAHLIVERELSEVVSRVESLAHAGEARYPRAAG
jgi:hypothetical protein